MAHLRYWPDSMFLAQYRTRHLPCRRSVGCHARTHVDRPCVQTLPECRLTNSVAAVPIRPVAHCKLWR